MFPGFINFRVFGLDILKTYSDSQPFTHIDKSEELSSKTCITLSGTFLCCPYITSTWNFLMWLCLNTPDRRIFLQLQGNLPTFSILSKLEYMLFFLWKKESEFIFAISAAPADVIAEAQYFSRVFHQRDTSSLVLSQITANSYDRRLKSIQTR